MSTAILEVKELNLRFHNSKKDVTLLQDISFAVHEKECLTILGESGSGKTLTTQCILGLIDEGFTVKGSVRFEDKNLLQESEEELRRLRGSLISMVMQNPMTAFNPLIRIEEQIVETFVEHTNWTRNEIVQKALDVFVQLQIRDAAESIKKYPHQLSGGMLQRMMIGIAILLKPRILIADEPTTALDALTQMEVLKAFRTIKESGTAMIFITHDLGVAKYISDKIVVFNKGRIVDTGSFDEIVEHASDPYTQLLVEKKRAVMRKFKQVMKEVPNA